MVLLRFAPSPTGALHLGGLRTALYNYLYARKLGGKWILRIEDTDATRFVPGSVQNIRETLDWAGLHYDYGPGKGGHHAPYFQSERLDLYRSYANKLLDSGHAYRCFCSEDKLASTRESLARSGSNETYDKACLHLTDEEVARRVKAGEKHIIRFNDSNLPERPSGHDIVFGQLKDNHGSLPTDPVLVKSDLFPTYHLASVVDDHEMGITHVLRGEEWLPSLPLHLDLYASLSLLPPQFAHLPILLNPDGTKMSKRSGTVRVMDDVRKNLEPGAVLNWLALAGWGASHGSTNTIAAPDYTTVMTLSEMIEKFDLSSLTHRRPILDMKPLKYLNRQHIKLTASTPEGLDSLTDRVFDAVKGEYSDSPYATKEYVKKILPVLNIDHVTVFPSLCRFFFVEPDYGSDEARKMIQRTGPFLYNEVIRKIVARIDKLDIKPWAHDPIQLMLHAEAALGQYPMKTFMTILRHALTGMKAGPSVADIMAILGPLRSAERLRRATEWI